MNNEAEGYAASLRQQACWIIRGRHTDLDECELCAAADFIERQQAEIEALTLILRHQPSGAVVMNAFAIVRALIRTKRAIVKELRQLQQDVTDVNHRTHRIEQRINRMSDQNDALEAAVAALTGHTADLAAAVVEHDVQVQMQIAELTEAIANSGAKDDPKVAAAIAAISDASAAIAKTSDTVKTETAALAASVIPAPVEPPPAPVEPAPTEPTA